MAIQRYLILTLFFILITGIPVLTAKEDSTPSEPASQSDLQQQEEGTNTILMLSGLVQLEEDIRQETESTKEKLKQSTSELEAESLKNQLAKLDRQLVEAGNDFERIATNVDVALFVEKKPETFSWQTEFAELVQPAIKELKRFTIRSRNKTKLRDTINEYEDLIPVAREAVQHLDYLSKTSKDTIIKEKLKELLPEWQNIEERIQKKLELARRELAQLEKNDTGLAQSLSKSTAEFFRERGIYLFGSMAAFVLILFLCRVVFRSLFSFLPQEIKKSQPFSIRFFDLLLRILGFFLAMFSGFLVLYFAEDWFLLSLAIIALIGFTWTLRQGITKMWQQARLLLNIGSVREGERITLYGVPWKLERIHFFCKLYNPSLDLRISIPVEDMMGQISRPYKQEEPWFPCIKGDWVVVGQQSRAKVVSLTHETVELVERGGKRIFYQTQDFLASVPVNLSRNFRLRVPFGISYNQQSIATSMVPTTIQTYIEKQFTEKGYDKKCLNLSVEFMQAGESSLDLMILADFKGEMAEVYKRLERFIQRCCVEACTLNNWEIPFAQLTLHVPEKDNEMRDTSISHDLQS